MKNLADVMGGIILLGICGIGVWSISSLPDPTDVDYFGPASFPQILLMALAICSLLLIVKGFRFAPEQSYLPKKSARKKLFLFVMLFYGYILVLTTLAHVFLAMETPLFRSGGAFCISTALFLLLALPLLGRCNIMQNLIVAATTTASLYAMFAIFFKVILP